MSTNFVFQCPVPQTGMGSQPAVGQPQGSAPRTPTWPWCRCYRWTDADDLQITRAVCYKV